MSALDYIPMTRELKIVPIVSKACRDGNCLDCLGYFALPEDQPKTRRPCQCQSCEHGWKKKAAQPEPTRQNPVESLPDTLPF